MEESVRDHNISPEEAILQEFRDAIGEDLELIAVLHDREIDALGIAQLKALEFPSLLGLQFSGEDALCAQKRMVEIVSELPEQADESFIDELAVDFADIYLTYRLRAAPTESVWLDKDHLVRQQPMFQVRSIYRKRGLKVTNEQMRSDDHLVTQLQFLAHLFKSCKEDEALREAAAFLDGHLLRWIGMFSEQVTERCNTPFYGGLARLTSAYLEELRDVLAKLLQEPRPEPVEVKREDSALELPTEQLPVVGPLTAPGW